LYRYGTNHPIAIANVGHNTGVSLYSISFERSDVYYDIDGQIDRLYAYNCRHERLTAAQDPERAPYPIKIHTNDSSKFHIVSDSITPDTFDLTGSEGRLFIKLDGMITRNGTPDQANGYTYTNWAGWYMNDPTIYSAFQYRASIENGYFGRNVNDRPYLPIFGYKKALGSNGTVIIRNDEIAMIRGRGYPVYLYLCAGSTLQIGDDEDASNNDVFTALTDSYLMLVPQGTSDSSESDGITLAGRKIRNGLAPLRLPALWQ
jgi:hypothetical protein